MFSSHNVPVKPGGHALKAVDRVQAHAALEALHLGAIIDVGLAVRAFETGRALTARGPVGIGDALRSVQAHRARARIGRFDVRDHAGIPSGVSLRDRVRTPAHVDRRLVTCPRAREHTGAKRPTNSVLYMEASVPDRDAPERRRSEEVAAEAQAVVDVLRQTDPFPIRSVRRLHSSLLRLSNVRYRRDEPTDHTVTILEDAP